MTRMKALILGTLTATMILGSSIVIAAEPPVDQNQADKSTAVVVQTTGAIGGGTGKALKK
jgi:hypothetical protein